ncbi:MAG: hypothetical protein IJF54_07665 [Clostridia bacterium]|nr:hypothetical protein [Clostridia bacterium]
MKRLISILLSVMMLLSVVAITSTVAYAAETDPTLGNGTTYYVDSQGGNDSNSGTSSSAAWKTLSKVNSTTFQPGDNILFKKGGVWTGTLYPKGSGEKGAPITISSYGTGNAMPLIDGNGVQFTQGGSWIDAAVYFCNQSYWTVQNLEVVNDSSTLGDRAGIHFDNTTTRTTRYGITIRNNKVHNIASDGNAGDHGRIAGICVWSRSWYNSFSDVLIEGNEVYDAKSTGIMVNAQCPADTTNGGKNIVIRNNVLNRIGGDGVLTNECVAPLVEYNVVNESHNVSIAACVALWPFACTDSLFQFNEAYNTKTRYDGQGLDCDYMCKNTTFQYNYSHDNEGGFMLICCEPTNWDGSQKGFNDGSVVRYNISQNDRHTLFQLTTNITNTTIYNNTLYTDWGIGTNIVSTYSRDGQYPDNTRFYNNIFYTLSSSGYDWGGCTNTVWENNLVYGTNVNGAPDDPNEINANPMLVNPGGAGIGFDTCDAYVLYNNSPAIGKGKVIENNGGRDFFGNPVSATEKPNIGAYNGPGVPYNVQTTTYEGGYVTLHDWENASTTHKNTQIPFISSNTTTWLSTASITTDANVLAPGSTKGIKIHNDQTAASNCALDVVVYKEWIANSIGMRFWVDGGGTDRSIEINFKGSDSMHYRKTTTAPADGGWIVISWDDTLYKNGPDVWQNVQVTPEIMRNTTEIMIYAKSLAAGGDLYIDDIQYKIDPAAVTTVATDATTTATTTATTVTTATTTAAPTTTAPITTEAPTQAPVVGGYTPWQNFESYNVGTGKPDCFSGNVQTWSKNVLGIVETSTIGGGAPNSTKTAYVTSTNGYTITADGFRIDFNTSGVAEFSQIQGYRIWMKASTDGVKARAHIASDLGNNKVARSNTEVAVSTAGAWYEFDFTPTFYFNNYGSFGSGSKTVTAQHLAEAKTFGALLAIPAGATVYVDDIEIKYADQSVVVTTTEVPTTTEAPTTTAAPTTTTKAPTYNNPYAVVGGYLSGISNNDVAQFIASFNAENGAEVKVLKSADEITTGKIGTGMDVVIYTHGAEKSRYTIVIYGDVDGDGETNATDLLIIKHHLLSVSTLEGSYYQAGKISRGDSVSASDILTLKRVLLKVETITQ